MTDENITRDERFESFEEALFLAACLEDKSVANLVSVDLVSYSFKNVLIVAIIVWNN